jgi:hypothetical protein
MPPPYWLNAEGAENIEHVKQIWEAGNSSLEAFLLLRRFL